MSIVGRYVGGLGVAACELWVVTRPRIVAQVSIRFIWFYLYISFIWLYMIISLQNNLIAYAAQREKNADWQVDRLWYNEKTPFEMWEISCRGPFKNYVTLMKGRGVGLGLRRCEKDANTAMLVTASDRPSIPLFYSGEGEELAVCHVTQHI